MVEFRSSSSSSPEDVEAVEYVSASWVEEDARTVLEAELKIELGVELEDAVVTVEGEDGVDGIEEEFAVCAGVLWPSYAITVIAEATMAMTATAVARAPAVTPGLEDRIASVLLRAEDNPTH